ncbi:hypothetical protein SAY86_001244 [Trapa natans]|uniref:DEUBAD domain-containing protein n=1 Tax=Trapa natans TaxID=22666 RepID=A0AAN7RM81_TRANT|nr:hypothetical protein SAY86_001244 [Trapa natans]
MAADQRRKGLNGDVADASLRDKSRGKKKQMGSVESNGFRVKPHASLEWDASRRRVIARREQIGLSWRKLRRFAEPLPLGHKILADAFDVPLELFELENLGGVLSYEVWQTCLSERERRFLAQFLPRETEPQQTVKQLLAGENFHFGNPFLDWEASLQSGSLHPDTVIHWEQSLKSEKRAYYFELHKYHNDMVGSLLKMKERWQSSSDLEKEYNQKMMRPRKVKEKKFSSVDPSEFQELDDSFAGTSKSSSLDAEEKTSYSDEQIDSFKNTGQLHKKITKKGSIKHNSGNHSASDNALVYEAKSIKGVRLKKRNIVYNDGTQYMSCVKISKQQHELAKSMEKSGSSIQPRSLGNLSNLHIQPYEVFVEEQEKKLHDHWLRMANHDLPLAYGIWNDVHSQRRQMMRLLEQELLEKNYSLGKDCDRDISESEPLPQRWNQGIDERLIMEDDKNFHSCPSEDQKDFREEDYASSVEDDEGSIGFINHQKGDDGRAAHQFVAKSHDGSPSSDINMVTGMMLDPNDANSGPDSPDDPFLNQVPPSSSRNPSFNQVGPELNSGSSPRDVTAYSGNLNGGDLIDTDQVPPSQSSDIWQPVSNASSMPLTYYDSSFVGCQFNSAAEIPVQSSLSPSDGEQRAPQWIDIGSDLHGQPQQLHRDPNSFVSYPSHLDQNELLQSIFNGQQGMLYPGNSNSIQKQLTPINFQLPSTGLTETYGHGMHNNIQQSISTGSMLSSVDGSRFLMQGPQEEHHMLPTSDSSIQAWGNQIQSTIQPPQTLPVPNWFPNSNEHQVRGGGWDTTTCGPSQTNNVMIDQSMYGILPHCNQLPSRPLPFDSMEQLMPARNYGHGLMSGLCIGNVLPHHQTAPLSPIDYSNRRDDETGWTSLPAHQNSGMNNSMGKSPYLGSWNS